MLSISDLYKKNNIVLAGESLKDVLRKPSPVQKWMGSRLLRWVRRLARLGRRKGLIEETYVSGYEHIPALDEDSVLIAFSHKTILDLFPILMTLAGVPRDRFRGVCLVGQGGLFYGRWLYELTPGFLRRGSLKKISARLLRIPAAWLRGLASLAIYPVFREGSDIPENAEAYASDEFAGPWLTGMEYDEFVKFAGRTNKRSIIDVQKKITDENWSFTVLPEGLYSHDGRISEPGALVALLAYRKKRKTLTASLAYDELCRDELGRIPVFVNIGSPLLPPGDKNSFDVFLKELRNCMQTRTPLLASNLIAATLKRYVSGGEFTREEFERDYHELATRTLDNEGLVVDPGLRQAEYRQERLARFYRHFEERWFVQRRASLSLNMEFIVRFDPGERAVNDLEWNYNVVFHAFE